MERLLIRRECYHDSVFLMAVSARLAQARGLSSAQVVLATPANCQLLRDQGFDEASLEGLGATDLVVALRGEDEAALQAGSALVQELLAHGVGAAAESMEEVPIGLAGGLSRLPEANLALISVPGEYAALEARQTLEQGLNVMLFSNNVPISEEVALKRRAVELGLLCMGPDCGTALLHGVPLGFANRLRRGPIGLVGASGTGLQEVSCQVHRLGSGVSHLIGTGGRDLSLEVGGLTALFAIDLLEADGATRVLVVVSKPPAPDVARRVLERLGALSKPSVVCFLGAEGLTAPSGVHPAATLSEAARLAVQLAHPEAALPNALEEARPLREALRRRMSALSPGRRYIRGLFCGGTLASETALILGRRGLTVGTNLGAGHALPEEEGHLVLDLGDDRFTQGRPHPMIDPELRAEPIRRLGSRSDCAVLLCDLVLGSGCHPDPAGVTARALTSLGASASGPIILCGITGTDLDLQDLRQQVRCLEEAGALVCMENALSAHLAADVAERAAREVAP